MAIVKMNKFTLISLLEHKENLLKSLQVFESVHFRDLHNGEETELSLFESGDNPEEVSSVESELAKVRFVLEKIGLCVDTHKSIKSLMLPPKTITFSEFDSFASDYDYMSVYEAVKTLDEKEKASKAEKNKLLSDNNNLDPWRLLDISPIKINSLKSVASFIGTVPKVGAEGFREDVERELDCAYVELFDQKKDDVGVLVMAPTKDADTLFSHLKSRGFGVANLSIDEIPAKIIKSNGERIVELESQTCEVRKAIQDLAKHREDFKILEDYFRTLLERIHACGNFAGTQKTLLLEGWVPKDASEELKAIVARCCGDEYYLTEEPVEKDSLDVPIKLKNGRLISAFEPITEMYSVPKYGEIDPTPLLAPFYFFFFGLMVGDAGYGLIFIALTAFALKKFNLRAGLRRYIKFFNCLGYSTVIAGILYGSLFGFSPSFLLFGSRVDPATGEVMRKALLDTQLDIPTMLVASVALGVVHVLFGLAVKCYVRLRDRDYLGAIFDSATWMIAVLSGVLWIVGQAAPEIIAPGMTRVALYVFFATLIALVATQGRSNPSLGGKIGGGIYGAYGITSYIGDLVSYTRIVALALSGAYIAFAFNEMAGLFPGILRFIFGTIIIVLGGLLNMGLAALGAYVHTCRLQYVEYFSKFYEGGGKPFKPFSLKNTYVSITK